VTLHATQRRVPTTADLDLRLAVENGHLTTWNRKYLF
jgi:hypothetical protein